MGSGGEEITREERDEQLAELDPTLYDQFVDRLERRCGICLRD